MRFTKGHGTGNDFVLYTDREGLYEPQVRGIIAVTDRRKGIGGDGIIRAVPTAMMHGCGTEVVDDSSQWFMDYRNADGSIAQMCGNGVRVFAEYLIAEQLVDVAVGESFVVGTRAGSKRVYRIAAHSYRVDMGPWRFTSPANIAAQGFDTRVVATGLENTRPGLSLSLGNPHVVVALTDIAELDSLDLFHMPQLDPVPQDGANVEFVVSDHAIGPVGRATMRVYERGVGETLSCGTGACAAALALRFGGGVDGPDNWEITVPGGVLTVTMPDEGVVELAGPAELVAVGETALLD